MPVRAVSSRIALSADAWSSCNFAGPQSKSMGTHVNRGMLSSPDAPCSRRGWIPA